MLKVRKAEVADLDAIMPMLLEKARRYETYQPVFHRVADGFEENNRPYIQNRVIGGKGIVLVALEGQEVVGFIHGELVDAPPVYNPGGKVTSVDEFVVKSPDLWATVGRTLLEAAMQAAKDRGSVLGNVVCGPKDGPKSKMLQDAGYSVASQWYVKPLGN